VTLTNMMFHHHFIRHSAKKIPGNPDCCGNAAGELIDEVC